MPHWLQVVTVALANPLRHFLVIIRGVFLKVMPAGEVASCLNLNFSDGGEAAVDDRITSFGLRLGAEIAGGRSHTRRGRWSRAC